MGITMRRVLCGAAALGSGAALAMTAAQQRVVPTPNPGTPVSLGDVAPMPGDQEETAIAVNPRNPKQIAVMSNGNVQSFPVGVMLSRTDDGGRHWHHGLLRIKGLASSRQPYCDPALSWTPQGELYAATLGLDSRMRPFAIVGESHNGGKTFTLDATYKTADFPSLASDAHNVWLTWQVSDTGANDFQGVDVAHASLDAHGVAHGWNRKALFKRFSSADYIPRTVAGPNGELATTWLRPGADGRENPYFIRVTRPDSNIFGPEHYVASSSIAIADPGPGPYPGQPRLQPLQAVAWDTSHGPHRGRIYFAWIDRLPAAEGNARLATQLRVIHSDDHGKSWSAPLEIADGQNLTRSYPALVVDPQNGEVTIFWRETIAGHRSASRIRAASSYDGERFSRAVNVSPVSAPSDGIMGPGDYMGVAAAPRKSFVAVPDNSGKIPGNPDGRRGQDIVVFELQRG